MSDKREMQYMVGSRFCAGIKAAKNQREINALAGRIEQRLESAKEKGVTGAGMTPTMRTAMMDAIYRVKDNMEKR